MLVISGEKDNTVPWAIANASFKREERNPAVTEIKELPNRGHSLTIDSGWQEVARSAWTSSAGSSSLARQLSGIGLAPQPEPGHPAVRVDVQLRRGHGRAAVQAEPGAHLLPAALVTAETVPVARARAPVIMPAPRVAGWPASPAGWPAPGAGWPSVMSVHRPRG